jgi:hypothetical protein
MGDKNYKHSVFGGSGPIFVTEKARGQTERLKFSVRKRYRQPLAIRLICLDRVAHGDATIL